MRDDNPYESPQAETAGAPKVLSKGMQKWASTRELGQSRFVWRSGVLGWGVTTGVFWSLFMSWGKGLPELLSLMGIALVLFPIGGYFWGKWVWHSIEKKFAKEMAEADSGSET